LSPDGDPAGVVKYMQEFVARVERNPRALGPVTADRIHCMLIGIPGMVETFERYFAACGNIGDARPAPWQISILTVGAWARLWKGRKSEAIAAIQQAEQLQHQFGTVRLVIERLGQLRALTEVALRNLSYARNVILPRIEAMQTPEMAGHSAVWLRPYRFGLARFYWVSEDAEGFRQLLPYLIAPRGPGEWPFVDMAAHVARGQMALFEKQWDLAEQSYREALRTHDKLRLPIIHADPRLGLAYVLLQQGKKAEAWTAFQPAYEEVIGERALGLLLLESRNVVNALLEIVPADLRRMANHTALLSEWAAWNDASPEPDGKVGLLAPLSEREVEVLAEVASGASNKHIARQLALSLHTVKRHIANILDKLDCDSRGQAADLYRKAKSDS
jgi:LuxR family maltose regulon positive regulatory protein